MVHALNEAGRVLVSEGILIDLRPYCVEAPLEVVFERSIEPAGLVDMSSNSPDDLAADQAVAAVVGTGDLEKLKSEYFDYPYYWASVKELLVDLNGQWKDDVVIPQVVLQKASALLKKDPARARLRIRMRAKLDVYEKR